LFGRSHAGANPRGHCARQRRRDWRSFRLFRSSSSGNRRGRGGRWRPHARHHGGHAQFLAGRHIRRHDQAGIRFRQPRIDRQVGGADAGQPPPAIAEFKQQMLLIVDHAKRRQTVKKCLVHMSERKGRNRVFIRHAIGNHRAHHNGRQGDRTVGKLFLQRLQQARSVCPAPQPHRIRFHQPFAQITRGIIRKGSIDQHHVQHQERHRPHYSPPLHHRLNCGG